MRGHEKTCKETERGKGECEEVKTQSYDVNRKKVYVPLCADVRVGHASLRGRLIPLRFLPSHPALSFAGRPSGSPPWVACTPPSSASTAHAPPSPPPTSLSTHNQDVSISQVQVTHQCQALYASRFRPRNAQNTLLGRQREKEEKRIRF